MNNFDPLVANGITYAPIKDIVMSDGPIYGHSPYTGNQYNMLPNDNDSFTSKKCRKISPWIKWPIGIATAALAILGIKKYGINPIISNIKKNISNAFNFCKKHIPFIKKP